MMNRIYLDYSATTPPDPQVVEAMVAVFGSSFGNASSVHSFGREARTILEQSRDRVAHWIGARSDEVFFTSGGTEADNHAVKGLALAGAKIGKNEIIVSAVEHHAVLEPAESLRKAGFNVKLLPVDGFGQVDPDRVKRAITPKTALISLMLANNEVGSINKIDEMSAIARDSGIAFHSDTVQAMGKIKVDVNKLGLDVLSISAHKFYGPKGIGAIYIRKGTRIEPFMEGGSQESNRRAGTENVPLAAGFAKAAELAEARSNEDYQKILDLRKKMLARLSEEFTGLLMNGHPTERLPHILSVSFDSSVTPLDGDAIIMGLDLEGVAVTSGSACTSGSLQASHVLLAMGRDERTARATVRFSLGRYTTEEEINFAADALKRVVERVAKAGTGR
ncbi:MAG: cysteine desulfurase family protein [Ignavibacteriales bacterium]|nr:cysteine desulfurase family protein [Ignavibacteriales bacterium]